MSQYQECMTKAMRAMPKGLSRQERGNLFCIEAKICSGKAKNKEEAATICANRPAPTPKASKKKSAGVGNINALVSCLLPKINQVEDLDSETLKGFLVDCVSVSVVNEKPKSKEKFIKKCFKENSSTGTLEVPMQEAAKLRKLCVAKYKEMQ